MPRALSDLVMALLKLDARGRPGSAAEVVERLSGIASLPGRGRKPLCTGVSDQPEARRARSRERSAAQALLRALRGRGGAAAIVAPGGFGRSRMLASFVLEAKLLGAAAVLVDATAVDSDRSVWPLRSSSACSRCCR